MNRALLILAPALSLALIAPLGAKTPPPPVPGGTLGTLPLGHYTCEKNGDAGGPIGTPVPTLDFEVMNYSTYRGVDGVPGSYLLTGDNVVMTGGGLKGLRLRRVMPAFLRVTGADGNVTETRCVLSSHRPQMQGDSGSDTEG